MADPFDNNVLTLRREMQSKKNQMQRLGTLNQRQKTEFKEEIYDFQLRIEDIESLIQQYERNPSKYNLTNNQLSSRKSDVQELVNLKISLEEILNGVSMSQVHTFSIQHAQKNLMDGANGPKGFADKYAPPTATNAQVYSSYEQQKMEQNRKLDMLNENTTKIKHVAIKIGDELDTQNDKLQELDHGIEKNTLNMLKTTDKMKKLIQESSTCGIITTIFLEIAIIVLIILYL